MKTTHQTTPIRIISLSTVLAALAATACGTAHADGLPGITMYGVADIYGEYGKGNRSEVSISSGGLSGSRLGFDAAKDLGNGVKAIAKLEAGVSLDTGESGQGGVLFGRQAYAGVSGALGTLTAGRQYTPQFIALDNDDPFDTGAGSAISSGIVSIFTSRANNSVVWNSPSYGDFSATVLLAAGESTTGSQTNSSLGEVNLHMGNNAYGLDLVVGGEKKAIDSGTNASATMVGGFYDFGVVKVMGGVQFVTNSTRAADTNDNRREFWAGVNVPVGGDSLWLGGGSSKVSKVSGTTASQYSVAYVHPIVKGFDVYGVLTSISNGDATAYSDDTATGSGPVVSAGKTASAAQVGIRYRF